jgi:hypothetical protein
MANQDCLNAAKLVGEDLTDRQLEEILDLLDIKATRLQREDPALARGDALQKAGAALALEKKLATLQAKRQRAFRVYALQQRLKQEQAMFAGGAKEDFVIRARNVGMEGNIEGAGLSVDAQQHGIKDSVLIGPMLQELDEAGLGDVALLKNKEFEAKVANEMARLNGDTGIKPTGDKHAAKMAEIFNRYTERGRHLQNQSGAAIRKLKGYITRQAHDQISIYRAGKETWKEKVRPLLHDQTFDGVKNVDEFLDNVWFDLASGVHEKANGSSDWLGGFTGPGSLAKRASAERVLHFKDPNAWLEYNNEFGKKSLFESVLDGLEYAARNTALMRVYGPNPEAAFNADLKRLTQRAKARGDVDTARELTEGRKVRAEFNEIGGGAQVRGNPTLAMWFGSVRLWLNMTTLGGVTWSAFPDIGIRAAVLRHNGVSLPETWGETTGRVFSALQNPADKAKAARLLNAGTTGFIGGVFQRFHATDSAHGAMVKANNRFFKITLLTAWTDGWARATGITLAGNLGDLATSGKSFAEMSSLLQTTLKRYGITEREWNVLRQSEIFDADGAPMLMPELVRELPDAAVLGYMGEAEATPGQVARAREDLATKLSTYYSDQVREALTFGGAKERAMLRFGLERGTVAGELVPLFTQFMQFPLTYVTKHWNRELHRAGQVDKMGLAHMLAATTALGFVSMTAKQYGRGEKPKEPEDAWDVAQMIGGAFMQGGGAGLYGDFLFGTLSRTGTDPLATLAGPAFGKASQAFGVVAAAAKGEDPSAKALKLGIGLVPYNNLFGARLAMDHMFLHALQEQVNPGYLRRYQRQVERDRNVEWWMEPTSAMNQ